MKSRQNKKGFTLVELLVVIAIIAILASVSVIGYLSFTEKARQSNDESLVSQLNIALKASEPLDGKPATYSEALDRVKESGFLVENLTPSSSKNEFLWNSEDNEYSIIKQDEIAAASANPDLWVIVDDVETLKEYTNKYSVYLSSTFKKNDEEELIIKNGFDSGKNVISTVTYEGATASKEVIINTNSAETNVNVTAFEDTTTSDTVKHYGTAGKVTLVNAGSHSYHEYGTTTFVEVTAGKLVAEATASIEVVYAKGAETVVIKNGTAEIKNAYTESATNEGGNVDLTVKTEEEINNEGNSAVSIASGYVVKVTKHDGSSKTVKMSTFREEWNKGTYYDLANPATITLTGDVDLSSEYNWGPIGNWQYPFNGTFDGAGHTVKNLVSKSGYANGIYANGTTIGYGEVYGFFGIVGGADCTIRNVKFENIDIQIDNGKNVGAVVGYVPDNAHYADDGNTFLPEGAEKYTAENTMGSHDLTLENVIVGSETDASKVYANSHVGGLVGKEYGSGNFTVKNCKNYAEVKSEGNAGGILGFSSNGSTSMTFDNVENHCKVTGKDVVGGIVSYADGTTTTFINCKNFGELNSTVKVSEKESGSVGGILGLTQSMVETLVFDNCSNAGNINANTSKGNVGGIYAGNYGGANFNGKLYFKHVISNTGILTGAAASCGDILGQLQTNQDISTVKVLTDVTNIDITLLDTPNNFEIKNKVNRGNGNTTISISIVK